MNFRNFSVISAILAINSCSGKVLDKNRPDAGNDSASASAGLYGYSPSSTGFDESQDDNIPLDELTVSEQTVEALISIDPDCPANQAITSQADSTRPSLALDYPVPDEIKNCNIRVKIGNVPLSLSHIYISEQLFYERHKSALVVFESEIRRRLNLSVTEDILSHLQGAELQRYNSLIAKVKGSAARQRILISIVQHYKVFIASAHGRAMTLAAQVKATKLVAKKARSLWDDLGKCISGRGTSKFFPAIAAGPIGLMVQAVIDTILDPSELQAAENDGLSENDRICRLRTNEYIDLKSELDNFDRHYELEANGVCSQKLTASCLDELVPLRLRKLEAERKLREACTNAFKERHRSLEIGDESTVNALAEQWVNLIIQIPDLDDQVTIDIGACDSTCSEPQNVSPGSCSFGIRFAGVTPPMGTTTCSEQFPCESPAYIHSNNCSVGYVCDYSKLPSSLNSLRAYKSIVSECVEDPNFQAPKFSENQNRPPETCPLTDVLKKWSSTEETTQRPASPYGQ